MSACHGKSTTMNGNDFAKNKDLQSIKSGLLTESRPSITIERPTEHGNSPLNHNQNIMSHTWNFKIYSFKRDWDLNK